LIASLPDQIYTRLLNQILSEDLKPGQRIVELEIAARMGTSQGPVREALQRLEKEGLVEKRPRSGTFISEIPEEDIRDLFLIRSLVEKRAITRTARLIQPAQLAELQRLVERMHAAARQDDLLTLAELDMDFHFRICAWSGSSSLVRAWLPLYLPIRRYVTQNHRRHFQNLADIASLHEPIIASLREGNPEKAAQGIEDHILLIIRQNQQN